MVFIICMLVFRWAGSNSWNSINGFNSEAKKYRCERKFHLKKKWCQWVKIFDPKNELFSKKVTFRGGKEIECQLVHHLDIFMIAIRVLLHGRNAAKTQYCFILKKNNNLFQCFLHFRNICAQHIPRPQAWGKNVRQRGERLAKSMELDKGWHHWSMSTSLSINLCLESVTFCNSGKGWHRWSQSQCQLLSVVLAKSPWCLRSASFAQNHDNRDQNIDDCNDEDGYQPVWWCWKLWY